VDSISSEASKKCFEITVFFTIIFLIYAGLKPEPGEDKVEITSAGRFLAPILFFAGPIMGSIAFFLARFIRRAFF